MLENLIKRLKEEGIEYEEINENKEDTISFGVMLCNESIPCEFTYNEEEGIIKFYTEILEFDDETAMDGLQLTNDINYSSVFLKAYLDDNNVLCAEYYFDARIGLPMELIDDILGDIGNSEEFVEQYI